MSKKRSGDHLGGGNGPSKAIKSSLNDRRAELDSKFPEITPTYPVPAYDSSKSLQTSSTLPPLPPIQDERLAKLAFTHSSIIDSKYSDTSQTTYERLEFLGDAYLELISSRIIYARFPQLLEGKMSSLRELMVRNTTLFSFAKAYRFHRLIKANDFDINKQGWQKVLADTFEAYVAAVIVSSEDGFRIAEEWLTTLWSDILLNEMRGKDKIVTKDWKTELSKTIGGKFVKIEYKEEKPMEMDARHRQWFFIGVYLTGWDYEDTRIGFGKGIGKKEAGIQAAKDALTKDSNIMKDAIAKKTESDAERKAAMELERADEEARGEVKE